MSEVGQGTITSSSGFNSVFTVVFAEEVHSYCDANCWRGAESQIIAQLGVNFPYPESSFLTGACSRCGIAFPLTQSHVSLHVMDEEWKEQLWFTTAQVHDDVTLAQFCPECEPPQFAQSELADENTFTESISEETPSLA